jgi:hypothetical protein
VIKNTEPSASKQSTPPPSSTSPRSNRTFDASFTCSIKASYAAWVSQRVRAPHRPHCGLGGLVDRKHSGQTSEKTNLASGASYACWQVGHRLLASARHCRWTTKLQRAHQVASVSSSTCCRQIAQVSPASCIRGVIP